MFRRYRAERVAQPYAGYRVEVLPHFTRYVATLPGAGGMIVFADLAATMLDTAITEQIQYFQDLGQRFEWKVHEFDAPGNLRERLQQRGFHPDEEEALLMIDVEQWTGRLQPPDGVRIENIQDREQLIDFVAAEQAIWPEDLSWHIDRFAAELEHAPHATSIYCAYAGNTAVGTGRITFPLESRIAELNGGGVRPELRGKGIFTALLSRRIEEARARGYRWIAVDAAPMSRPILVRKGFQHICWTYPMNYRS